MLLYIGVICLLQAAIVPAQLLTLKDGKVGVNFAGFHADAGLGGLLTGNAAHGGLSASAGTPWGARSAAGLGGSLDGRTAGIAYAGAQANPEVGASALIGGSVGEQGYIGSEAHANGKVAATHYKTEYADKALRSQHVTSGPPVLNEPLPTYVQKIKPPKKYTLISQTASDHNTAHVATGSINDHDASATKHIANLHNATTTPINGVNPAPLITVKRQRLRVKRPRHHQRTVYVSKQLEEPQHTLQPQQQPQSVQPNGAVEPQPESPRTARPAHTRQYIKTVQVQQPAVDYNIHADAGFAPAPPQLHGNVVGSALAIPIGILRSLQESLGGLAVQTHYKVEKH